MTRSVAVGSVLGATLFALLVISVGTGEIAIPPDEVIATLFGGGDRATSFVIETLRLPRALCGLLIGLALGASGAIFQSLTRNPLGSPDIVGFVQGAAVGAVLEIVVFGGGTFAIAAGAVVGGVATAVVVYALSFRGGASGYRLILVGIGVSFMLIAVTDYLLTRSTLEEAQAAQRVADRLAQRPRLGARAPDRGRARRARPDRRGCSAASCGCSSSATRRRARSASASSGRGWRSSSSPSR